ncbi:MAG: 4a-hydroxytetrahydrobiopterin dehydratase [Gammaproteobacteria bacterium]
MGGLSEQHCQAISKGSPPLNDPQLHDFLKQVPDWALTSSHAAIHREFHFRNYYETMAFVNAVAWIAHQQDHHPDLEVSYSRCKIIYTTHSVGGLSQNDFICAAHIDMLLT